MTTDNKAETLVVNCKSLAIKDAKIEQVSPKSVPKLSSKREEKIDNDLHKVITPNKSLGLVGNCKIRLIID